MFKVLLIIYIVGGGGGINTNSKDYVYNPGFNFQVFDSMENCNLAKEKMEKMINNWYSGENKNNIIKFDSSIECVEMPQPAYALPPKNEELKQPLISNRKTHKRWNDLD